MKRFSLYLLIMVLLGTPVAAWCQDSQTAPGGEGAQVDKQGEGAAQEAAGQEEQATGEEAAELPAVHYLMEPDIEAWLGGRFVHLDGSTRAMEYGWPHSSVAGGFNLHYNPLPNRLDAELNWLNPYDYHADFSYAYKDVFKLSYTGFGLWHNLDHYVPLHFPAPTVDRNLNDPYHVKISDDRIYLRLKWPERAYHLFTDFRQLEKEGTIQERFYDGVTKNSRSRDIDWITRRYIAGINGNLGPVEVEYSHMIKTFDPHGDVKTSVLILGFIPRERSVVPSFETNSDTIKAHTDLTGGVVASATFITGEKTNHHSASEVDFNRGYADLTLIPFEHVTVAVRYRYKDLQERVPSTIGSSAFGLNNGTPLDPMDSRTNIAGVAVRYAPINAFAVKADYTFEKVQRTNAGIWSTQVDTGPPVTAVLPFQSIPYEQNIHTVKLAVNTRPAKSLGFKGSVEYTYTEEPAYPVDPKNAYKGVFDADWSLAKDADLSVYYKLDRENNNFPHMNLQNDNAGALATWTPLERLSLYANYDYSRYRNDRDIKLLAGTAPTETFFPTDRVPYTDSSHLYALGANYSFPFPLTLGAEYHQSWSKGLFRTNVGPTQGITTDGLGDATDLRIRETGGNFNARYDLPKGWGTSVTYTVNDFKDLAKKPQDGNLDGTAHTVLVMLSKKW